VTFSSITEQLRKDAALFIMIAVVLALMIFTAYAPVPAQQQQDGPKACWTEDKADGSTERICGNVKLAPKGSHDFSDTPSTTKNTALQGEYI
jgi:hypothetical protein